MSTSCKRYHLEPTFKQHTSVEDKNGVIVDIAVETGEANEGKQLLDQINRIEANTGVPITTVTADAGYAHANNYAALEEANVNTVIPPQRQSVRKKGTQKIPVRRFKFDARNDRVKCPGGKYLTKKGRVSGTNNHTYRTRACDCSRCPLRKRCFSEKAKTRSIVVIENFSALLRARRKKAKGWDEATRELYDRHRWRVEGAHGRAKEHHGLRRAVRRGLDNIAIQAYLAAAVMNLKILVKGAASQTLGILWLIRLPCALTMPHVRIKISNAMAV